MAHLSEGVARLQRQASACYSLSGLEAIALESKTVYFFWLPSQTSRCENSIVFEKIADYCLHLPEDATVCILTTPPDAAALLPHLEKTLKFQLWVAVKTVSNICTDTPGVLPHRHMALVILTRYRGSLRHTKTRIGYTYCPACGKTTKDYGGKKHTYHEYGTLMSDVWRDIECDPDKNIDPLIERIRDLFGLEPYKTLQIIDLRACVELADETASKVMTKSDLPLEWAQNGIPMDSQLVNKDCFEALRVIPDNSIDFCFVDPPYNIQKKYDNCNDALEMVEYFAWCDRWLTELCRVLKPGRTLAVLNIPLWAVRHFQHLNTLMDYQDWIVWEGLSLPVRMIMPAHYAILCFSKGRSRPLPGLTGDTPISIESESLKPLNALYCLRASCISSRNRHGLSDRKQISDLWSDIHRIKHNSRRVDHPCQLPPLLMRRLFALFTYSGETILDCFNGAGTSTLVAQQMNRNFVGIEISEHYHCLAKARHEQLAQGEDPFGKGDVTPTAKNSRVQRVTKQRYEVSKKELQLDVKRIAQNLGRLPTRAEVEQLSKFPFDYFDKYFISWAEVCAAARTTGMSELPLTSEVTVPQLALALE